MATAVPAAERAGGGRRALVLGLVGLALVGAAGCGDQAGPPAAPLEPGTRVSPQRYLADTAAAAKAARDFTAVVQRAGPRLTAASLRSAAPALSATLARAELAAERLSAQRLEDRRLERQRVRAAPLYAVVVADMRRVVAAARAARPAPAAAAARRLGADMDALRQANAAALP
jgi:hypothetical protein